MPKEWTFVTTHKTRCYRRMILCMVTLRGTCMRMTGWHSCIYIYTSQPSSQPSKETQPANKQAIFESKIRFIKFTVPRLQSPSRITRTKSHQTRQPIHFSKNCTHHCGQPFLPSDTPPTPRRHSIEGGQRARVPPSTAPTTARPRATLNRVERLFFLAPEIGFYRPFRLALPSAVATRIPG